MFSPPGSAGAPKGWRLRIWRARWRCFFSGDAASEKGGTYLPGSGLDERPPRREAPHREHHPPDPPLAEGAGGEGPGVGVTGGVGDPALHSRAAAAATDRFAVDATDKIPARGPVAHYGAIGRAASHAPSSIERPQPLWRDGGGLVRRRQNLRECLWSRGAGHGGRRWGGSQDGWRQEDEQEQCDTELDSHLFPPSGAWKMRHSSKYSLPRGRVGATQRSAQSRLEEGGDGGIVGVEEIVPDT